MNFAALKNYAIARIQEASTWRGFVLCLTGLGASIKPEVQEAIITIGLLAAGAVGVLFPDAKKDKQ